MHAQTSLSIRLGRDSLADASVRGADMLGMLGWDVIGVDMVALSMGGHIILTEPLIHTGSCCLSNV